MKLNLKRWLAFLLAAVLVVCACVYSSSDGFLKANTGDGEQAETQKVNETEVLVIANQDGQPEEREEEEPSKEKQADVQEPTTAEPKTESGAGEGVSPEEAKEEGPSGMEQPAAAGEPVTQPEESGEEARLSSAPEEPPALPAEEEKPAQVLTAAAGDGARITMTAPKGALPEGAYITAKAVYATESVWDAVEDAAKTEGKQLTELKVYDIKIFDADGNEIQPDENVTVSISGAGVEGDSISVHRVENGNAEKITDIPDGNHAEFEAEHFTYYTISVFSDQDGSQKKNGESNEEKQQWVYVYVRLGGDIDGNKETLKKLGLEKNDHGWCTVGKVLANLPEAAPDKDLTGTAYFTQVESVLGKIEFYNGVKNLDFGKIKWETLKTSYGADNYPEVLSGTSSWHLDGYLEFPFPTDTDTVKYVDLDKSASVPEAKAGDTVRYTITINNRQDYELKDVIIKDEAQGMHGSVTNVKGAVWDKESRTFKIPVVPENYEKAEITYDYVVTDQDAGKTIVNTVTIENKDVKAVEETSRRTATVKVKGNIEGGAVTVGVGDNYTYDGGSHRWSPVVKSGNAVLKEGEDYDVSYTREGETTTDFTNAGGIKVTITGKGSYAGTITREYKILRKTLHIKTGSAQKVYDGTPLIGKEAGSEKDGFVGGLYVDGLAERDKKRIGFELPATLTEVGKADNKYTINWNDADPSNYEIESEIGELSITQKDLNEQAPGGQALTVENIENKVYNGQDQRLVPIVKYNGKVLLEDTDYTLSYQGEKDCKNVTGKDIKVAITGTGNYKGIKTVAYQITPTPLAVATGSATKTYDGTPCTCETVEVTGFVGNESADVKGIGSLTNVGTIKNEYQINWAKASAKKDNYFIESVKHGTLEVFAAAYKLEVEGYLGSYDGRAHGIRINAPKDAKITYYDADGKIISNQFKDVTGSTPVQVYYKVERENYQTIEGKTTVMISQALLTVETPSGQKVYDGTPLRTVGNNGEPVKGSVKGLAAGETVTVFTKGEQTDVGSSPNGYEIQWGSADENNYEINLKDSRIGTLEVTARSLEAAAGMAVDSPREFVTYEGIEYQWVPTVKDGAKLLTEGRDYAVTYQRGDKASDDFINAGKITVLITGKGNYAGTVARTYEIRPKTMTIDTGSAEKVYDGKPLVGKEADFGLRVVGLAEKDEAELGFEQPVSQTDVGEAVNQCSVASWGQADPKNYIIEEKFGTLKVTAKSLAPDPDNPENNTMSVDEPADVVYDGNSHKWEPEVKDGGKQLTPGTDYEVAYQGGRVETSDFTNVGEIKVTVTGKGNYEGAIEKTYSITPAKLTLVSDDLSKVYDGTALENGNTALKEESGWVKGERAPIAFTASQTLVGSTDNVFQVDWDAAGAARATADEAGVAAAKKENYVVQYAYGELSVVTQKADGQIDVDQVLSKTHDSTKRYKPGDQITFNIGVKNIYNTVKTVTVHEQPGVTVEGSASERIEPGETKTFKAVYTVTDQDIINRSFTNTVKVEFEGEGGMFTKEDTVTEYELVEPKAVLFLDKEVVNWTDQHIFKVGEKIQYRIKVRNDGTLTLYNVKVTDPLANQNWEIEELAPNAEAVEYTASYTVKDSDLAAGHVLNTVTASVDQPDSATEVTVTGNTSVDVPTEIAAPSLFVEKTASLPGSADGKAALGDVVTYTIRVINNGNVAVNNINITDGLIGKSWNKEGFLNLSSITLKPEESKVVTADYTVTEDDILKGSVTNIATAAGNELNGETVTGTATVYTVPVSTNYTVTKKVLNPQQLYKVGDKIRYEIKVTSQANVTLHNLVVTDQLGGAEGTVVFTELNGNSLNEDGTVTIAELGAGKTAVLNCEYTVVRADAGKSIVNTASVKADPVVPGPGNPNHTDNPIDPGIKTAPSDPARTENIYNLVIHYVYADGREAAPDVVAQHLAGETFIYHSPVIEGYTADYLFLRTEAAGMPAEDVELTITYTQNTAPETPAGSGTPDGVGGSDSSGTPDRPGTPDGTGGSDSSGTPDRPGTPDITGTPDSSGTPDAAGTPDGFGVPDGAEAPVGSGAPAASSGPGIPVAEIADEEVPLNPGGALATDDEGRVILIPVEDEEVPLANFHAGHKCCMLHALLMLAALLAYAWYTKSMKEHQEKIAGLRDKYEAEMLKRG